MEEEGIDCKIPLILKRDESQHTTRAANESRLITKSRWIVEARNEYIKTIFHFIDGIISTAHAFRIYDFYLITGAIINCYRNLILMEETTVLAHRIIEKVNTPNIMQARVEQENLFRKNAVWNKLNKNDDQDFQDVICDTNYLKELTFDIYQIGLAPSYIQDKLDIEAIDVFEFDEQK